MPEPFGQTAPGPVLRAFHEAGPEGVTLHAPAHLHQFGRTPNRAGVKAPLVHWALAVRPVKHMPAHGMGAGYPSHEARERIGVGRTQHDVPVIGHDAVGEQAHRIARESLGQGL